MAKYRWYHPDNCKYLWKPYDESVGGPPTLSEPSPDFTFNSKNKTLSAAEPWKTYDDHGFVILSCQTLDEAEELVQKFIVVETR